MQNSSLESKRQEISAVIAKNADKLRRLVHMQRNDPKKAEYQQNLNSYALAAKSLQENVQQANQFYSQLTERCNQLSAKVQEYTNTRNQ